MRTQTRFLTLLAALLSLPLAGFALAAAAYIAISLAAEPWYRGTFAAYGSRLLVLYLLYAIGVTAAASLAVRQPRPSARGRRMRQYAVIVGILAAALLEMTFWSDLSDHMAHGLLLLPFVAWKLAGLSQRAAS
jgi:hypothetical protein